MAADTTDDFQKELVDLFVQEAHEWLQNIHVALDELQQGPAPERHAKLIETISAGVTNLGGSAATINLPDVTHASFAAIPCVERIDATVIQEYLARVSEAEESFLKVIDARVPELFKKMSALKIDGGEASSRMTALEGSLQDVARLRIEAQQVNAGSAMMFFTGLHSLLTVVAQRRVLLASTRVDSVKARLHVMGGAIRQWVEHGRAQRAAIDQLFPAGRS